MAAPSPRRVRALAETLADANLQVYLEAMQGIAESAGALPPTDITDQAVLDGIDKRAAVSAKSILETQAERAAVLLNLYPEDRRRAQSEFNAWHERQADVIAQYEARMAASAALDDFTTSNALEGTEHLEPTEAAVSDECQDAIDQGEVDIGTLGSFPAHPNCPHYAVRTYHNLPDDPSDLWLGQE